jgi:hypothetical protein
VSVVIAMGDSISAGFAAGAGLGALAEIKQDVGVERPQALPMEFRGIAFSAGKGDDSQVTVPYFLGHFNKSLTGWSTGTTIPQLPSERGTWNVDKDALNVALTNAHSWELAVQVERLKNYSSEIPGFQNRWKLLTLMIGANDLCDGGDGNGHEACDGIASHANDLAARYETNLRATLQSLLDSQSRIVIQIVSLLSFSSVYRVRSGHWWCRTLHRAAAECNCLDRSVDGGTAVNDQQLADWDRTTGLLNDVIEKLTIEFNLRRADFAVVNVVAIKGQEIPSGKYLSNLDCFHPSAFAHSTFANVLWNSLFDKRRVPAPISDNSSLYCPTADDVIHVVQTARDETMAVV